MRTIEFATFKQQYENEPVIFFFDIDSIGRDDLEKGLTRAECIEKSHTAIPLSEFDTDWNDTDNSTNAENKPSTYIPSPKETWCYVSMR